MKTMRRGLWLVLALALMLTAAGCDEGEKETVGAPMQQLDALWNEPFDTVTRLIATVPDEATFDRYRDLVTEELERLDAQFDIYAAPEAGHDLSRLNACAGREAVAISPETFDLLEYGIEAYDVTEGRVNIMLGSVLRLWHEARTEGLAHPDRAAVPEASALEEAARHTSIEGLVLDREAGTAYLTDPASSIDVGALAKGYALDAVAARLKEAGATSFLLDMGGSVYAVGRNERTGRAWRIGVQNPDLTAEEAIVEVIEPDDRFVTTSGSYERFFMVDGVRYPHIIDPVTRMPGRLHESVTVVTDEAVWGDIWSTALFLMTTEEAARLLPASYPALFIEADGRRITCHGFETLRAATR